MWELARAAICTAHAKECAPCTLAGRRPASSLWFPCPVSYSALLHVQHCRQAFAAVHQCVNQVCTMCKDCHQLHKRTPWDKCLHKRTLSDRCLHVRTPSNKGLTACWQAAEDAHQALIFSSSKFSMSYLLMPQSINNRCGTGYIGQAAAATAGPDTGQAAAATPSVNTDTPR